MSEDHSDSTRQKIARLIDLVEAGVARCGAPDLRPWEAGALAAEWFEHELGPLVAAIRADFKEHEIDRSDTALATARRTGTFTPTFL